MFQKKGAIYLDQGMEICREFYARLLFLPNPNRPSNDWYVSEEENKQLYEIWLREKPLPTPTIPLRENDPNVQRLRLFEKSIGYTFRNTNLLVQALTHSSWHSVDSSASCKFEIGIEK